MKFITNLSYLVHTKATSRIHIHDEDSKLSSQLRIFVSITALSWVDAIFNDSLMIL